MARYFGFDAALGARPSRDRSPVRPPGRAEPWPSDTVLLQAHFDTVDIEQGPFDQRWQTLQETRPRFIRNFGGDILQLDIPSGWYHGESHKLCNERPRVH